MTVTQTLFNGFKTANSVRVAELQVQSGREALRNVGQGVLLDAVTAYTNVLANQSLVEAQRSNVAFLRETLGITQKRLNAGDVTPTDTAQAEARLKSRPCRSQRRRSQSRDQPGDLRPGDRQRRRRNCDPPKPSTAICRAAATTPPTSPSSEHPAVMAASFDVDVASTTIRVAESSLLPTVTVQGSASHSRDADPTLEHLRHRSGLGHRPVEPRRSTMAAPRPRRPGRPRNWRRRAGWCSTRSATRRAPRRSAPGWPMKAPRSRSPRPNPRCVPRPSHWQAYRRKHSGGQRTTVDVLNSQQDLISAKARLIGAQRDRVIASYTLLSAIGRLDVKTLASIRRTICPRCITIRSATPGTACARRQGSNQA